MSATRKVERPLRVDFCPMRIDQRRTTAADQRRSVGHELPFERAATIDVQKSFLVNKRSFDPREAFYSRSQSPNGSKTRRAQSCAPYAKLGWTATEITAQCAAILRTR
jgi:hypothetical protein